MISIITCTKNNSLFENLSTNIESTIDCQHEIIKIDNSAGYLSISEAYNKGLEKAQYEIIVLVHEDILFHTPSWGKILIDKFKFIPEIGCLGIAGALLKTKSPSAWWDAGTNNLIMNLIQHDGKRKSLICEGWVEEDLLKEVAVVDGVLMVLKRSTGFRFDTGIPGFHCYDLNLSIQLRLNGYKVFVTKEILIEHYSLGSINKSWVNSTSILHKKYNDYLPISVVSDLYKFKNLEFLNLYKFIRHAIKYKLYLIAIYYWFRLFKDKPLAFGTHYSIFKSLFK